MALNIQPSPQPQLGPSVAPDYSLANAMAVISVLEGTVPVWLPMQISSCSYVCAKRTTGSDVISCVTSTVAPRLPGALQTTSNTTKAVDETTGKGLRRHRQLAPFASTLSRSPLEPTADAEAVERERLNAALLAEHREFMAKLKEKRHERAMLETYGAARIQAASRGYLLRKHWFAVKQSLLERQQVRAELRAIIAAAAPHLVLTAAEARARNASRRAAAAACLQRAYRVHAACRAVSRRRAAALAERRRRAATAIQTQVRAAAARGAAEAARRRRDAFARARAALTLQQCWRAHSARRRVRRQRRRLHAAAAMLIQSAWRAKLAQARVAALRRQRADAAPLLQQAAAAALPAAEAAALPAAAAAAVTAAMAVATVETAAVAVAVTAAAVLPVAVTAAATAVPSAAVATAAQAPAVVAGVGAEAVAEEMRVAAAAAQPQQQPSR
ncbi:hypothetical protein JKP88DRAFT_296177 [Tribonema minus]|uniref:Uncharacterized protein n=1 Tax=Tribonema minus TaxID=303371 RepID=A0A835ZIR4_9STRA|nr:hypothetical protein JKP88DRAFT_296177 [Tribonema minus]